MTKARRTPLTLGLFLGLALAGGVAHATPTRTDALVDLRRQEAGLQDRIARLELDRLVARIDATIPDRHARPAAIDEADRELAAYAY